MEMKSLNLGYLRVKVRNRLTLIPLKSQYPQPGEQRRGGNVTTFFLCATRSELWRRLSQRYLVFVSIGSSHFFHYHIAFVGRQAQRHGTLGAPEARLQQNLDSIHFRCYRSLSALLGPCLSQNVLLF